MGSRASALATIAVSLAEGLAIVVVGILLEAIERAAIAATSAVLTPDGPSIGLEVELAGYDERVN